MKLNDVQGLSDKNLKIKVAELSGWIHCQWDGYDNPDSHAWFDVDSTMPVEFSKVPNYSTDDVAIQKIINCYTCQSTSNMVKYNGILFHIIYKDNLIKNVTFGELPNVNLTARQKAEAFVYLMTYREKIEKGD